MNVNGRLGQIEKQLAVYVEENPTGLMEAAARILNPSNADWQAACESIAATMPEGYQQILHADLARLRDLGLSATSWEPLDHYSQMPINRTGKPHPEPLTQRFFELARLRIYQCPRPLALPEAFCRVLTGLDPDKWLDFGVHCEVCTLDHPGLGYYEDRRCAHRRLFDHCVLCGGPVKWMDAQQRNSRPCHLSQGSPYRLAMATLEEPGE